MRRAEGNAFFVEELVGAAAEPGSWVPDDLADVLLVRLDRLDDAARQVVRVASVAGRKVAHDLLVAASGLDGRRARGGAAQGRRDERPGRRRRHATPSGTRCSARRSTTTCCRASGCGCTRSTPRRCARAGPRHRRRAGPARPAGPRPRHRARRQHPGRRRGDGGRRPRRGRPPLPAGARAARRPGPAPSAATIDVSKLVVSAAERADDLRPAEPGRRSCSRSSSTQLPAGRPADAWRARLLAARADALMLTETDDRPARPISQQAVDLLPDDVGGLRAKVLAVHARVLSGVRQVRRGAGRRPRRAGAGREARPARAGVRRRSPR